MVASRRVAGFWRRALALPLADWLLAGACLLFALALAPARYLPLIDLPQHASQIASWLRLSDPRYPDGSLFELNFTTPYWVAYGLARALAPLLGVVPALRLVVVLAIVATAWSVRGLARDLGHSPWLGLLSLPAAVGYSYYFGFVSFLAATPLAISCWRLALRHARQPTWKSGFGLGGLLLVTFVCHALGLAVALAGTLPLLCERGTLRERLWRLLPVLPAGVLVGSWLPGLIRFGEHGGEYWGLGYQRIVSVPGLLVGLDAADPVGVTIGALLLSVCGWLAWGRPQRSVFRWAPLVGLMLGYLLLPLQLRAVGFVYPRLVAFLIPAALLAFEPGIRPSLQPWAPRLAAGITAVWLTLFGGRLMLFQEECRDFERVLRDMPEGLAVRPLVFERESRAFPGVAAFLHFSAYYQVEKGGTQGYSFTRNATSVVRERVPRVHPMPDGAEWLPDGFDAGRELPFFDYFLVRSEHDRGLELFGAFPNTVQLVSRHGQWWGYEKRPVLAVR